MKLTYSLDSAAPRFFIGELPHPEMDRKTIKFKSDNAISVDFPFPLYEVGEMLCHHRDGQSAVTLLLTLSVGRTPPDPTPVGNGWKPVPNSDIRSNIWVALPQEVVKEIRKSADAGCDYELTLKDVELVNENATPASS